MEIKDEANSQFTFPVGGTFPIASDLNLLVTKRQGFLLGVKYKFGGGQKATQAAAEYN